MSKNERLDSLLAQATRLYQDDKDEQALQLAEEGLKLLNKPNRKNGELYFKFMRIKSGCLYYIDGTDVNETIDALKETLELSHLYNKNDTLNIYIYEKLGVRLGSVEDWDAVEDCLGKAVELTSRYFGEESIDYAIIQMRIAYYYCYREQYDKASPVVMSILQILKRYDDEQKYLNELANWRRWFYYPRRWGDRTSKYIFESIINLYNKGFVYENDSVIGDYIELSYICDLLGDRKGCYEANLKAEELDLQTGGEFREFILHQKIRAASRYLKRNEALASIDSLRTFCQDEDSLAQRSLDLQEVLVYLDNDTVLPERGVQLMNELLEFDSLSRDDRVTLLYNAGLAMANPDDAISYFTQYLKEEDEDGISHGLTYAKALKELGKRYMRKGEYATAMSYFQLSYDIYNRLTTGGDFSYFQLLDSYAQCSFNYGQYGRAVALAEKGRSLFLENPEIGDIFIWYTLLCSYEILGNQESFESRLNEFESLVSQYDSKGAKPYLEYMLMKNEYKNKKNIEKARYYFDKLCGYPQEYITDDLRFDLYSWQSVFYPDSHESNSFDELVDIISQASSIDVHLANYLYLYALALMDMGDYNSSNFLLKQINGIIHDDPDYYINAIISAYNVNDYEQCQSLYYDVIELLNKQMKATVGMTENEVENYWNQYNRLKNYLFLCRPDEKGDSELYTILLTQKNFVLNSTIQLNTIIRETNNPVLRSLNEQRQSINKEINLLKKDGINNDYLDSLKLRSIEVERDLARSITDYSILDIFGKYTYKDVSSALTPRQAAIEFVDYTYQDQHYYAAMMAKNGWDSPAFIHLFEEDEILPTLSKQPKVLYDPNLPISHELYDMIWTPIMEKLGDVTELFVSMTGLLHTIPVEILSDKDGIILGDKCVVHRVSSTKYVIDKNTSYSIQFATPVLMGDINYSRNDVQGTNDYVTSDFSYAMNRAIGQSISELPGTKREITQISGLLKKAHYSPLVYTRTAATEEAFKSLGEISPTLLHIATHGFYIPLDRVGRFSYFDDENDVSTLSLSGLLLAGSSKAWGGDVPTNQEDGVLTSKEISGIDLGNVSLLVLSACETGLGEINDNGVYGIQRAFKNAGVKSIIMALWEVDDNATELLMESFYKSLLAGMSTRDAFTSAQRQVRNKKGFNNPYYWGGFVLLD